MSNAENITIIEIPVETEEWYREQLAAIVHEEMLEKESSKFLYYNPNHEQAMLFADDVRDTRLLKEAYNVRKNRVYLRNNSSLLATSNKSSMIAYRAGHLEFPTHGGLILDLLSAKPESVTIEAQNRFSSKLAQPAKTHILILMTPGVQPFQLGGLFHILSADVERLVCQG